MTTFLATPIDCCGLRLPLIAGCHATAERTQNTISPNGFKNILRKIENRAPLFITSTVLVIPGLTRNPVLFQIFMKLDAGSVIPVPDQVRDDGSGTFMTVRKQFNFELRHRLLARIILKKMPHDELYGGLVNMIVFASIREMGPAV